MDGAELDPALRRPSGSVNHRIVMRLRRSHLGRHRDLPFSVHALCFGPAHPTRNSTIFAMQALDREIPDELAALSRLASVHGRWRANERPAAQQGIDSEGNH